MNKYHAGHTSSTRDGKCIVCNKISGTFLTISRKTNSGTQIGISVETPVCDRCYNKVAKEKNVLIAQCVAINTMLFSLTESNKQEGDE